MALVPRWAPGTVAPVPCDYGHLNVAPVLIQPWSPQVCGSCPQRSTDTSVSPQAMVTSGCGTWMTTDTLRLWHLSPWNHSHLSGVAPVPTQPQPPRWSGTCPHATPRCHSTVQALCVPQSGVTLSRGEGGSRVTSCISPWMSPTLLASPATSPGHGGVLGGAISPRNPSGHPNPRGGEVTRAGGDTWVPPLLQDPPPRGN